MSKGFMRISRDKLDSWCWRGNMNKNYLMMYLLVKANFKDEPFETIIVKRGQLVFSYDKLSMETGMPLQTLRTTLRDLEKTNQITTKPTRRWSLLTICDYDGWQYDDSITNTQLVTQSVTQTDNNIINKEINNNIKEILTDVSTKKDDVGELSLFNEPEKINAEPTENMKIASFNYSQFMDFFNDALKEHGSRISAVRKIDERRKNMLHARMKDYGVDSVYEVVSKVVNSSFLNNGSNTGWRADFDWIFGPINFRNIIEGKYDDRVTPVVLEESEKSNDWQS